MVVETPFLARVLHERYAGDIADAVRLHGDSMAAQAVRFIVDGAAQGQANSGCQPDAAAARWRPARQARAKQGRWTRPSLHSLDEFVAGPEGRLALEAARRLSTHTVQAPAPSVLFVGGCGTGKTHLLQGAVGGHTGGGGSARYMTAEAFANEFIAAVRNKRVEPFRRTYRTLDLLCIDDVHALEGKPATQLELQHTLDALRQRGGTFGVSCAGPLRQFPGLRESLASRLASGLGVNLAPPGGIVFAQAAERIAARRGLRLGPAAAGELVKNGLDGRAPTTIRDLEGLIVRVEAVHRLLGGGRGVEHGMVGLVAVQRAREEWRASARVADGPRRPLRADEVLSVVCEALSVEVNEVLGSGRHVRVVAARAVAAHLCRRLTTMSYPEIAKALGRPNHSTVITACQRLGRHMAEGRRVSLGPGREEPTCGELCEQLAVRLGGGAPAGSGTRNLVPALP